MQDDPPPGDGRQPAPADSPAPDDPGRSTPAAEDRADEPSADEPSADEQRADGERVDEESADDRPQVFALVRKGAQWRLGRREFLAAAAASGAAGCASADTPDTHDHAPAAPTDAAKSALSPDVPAKAPAAIPLPTEVSEVVRQQAADCTDVSAHRGAVQCLAASADGAWLVSGGIDGLVKLWSLPQGAFVQTFTGHKNSVTAAAFAGDSTLVTADAAGQVRVWDPRPAEPSATGERASFAGGVGGLSALAVASNGGRMAGAGRLEIVVWKGADGSRERTVAVRSPSGLQFTADGGALLCGDGTGVRVVSGADTTTVATVGNSPVTAFALTTQGHLVTATRSGMIRVWSFPPSEPGAKPLVERDATGGVRPTSAIAKTIVAVSPAGDLLASAGDDRVIRLWSLPDLRPLLELRGGAPQVTALCVSGDGKWLASAGSDGTIQLWALPDGEPNTCLLDLAATRPTAKGVQYKTKDAVTERWVTYTLPCGSPIPAGATCICNCVPGSLTIPATPKTQTRTPVCSCVSHVITRTTHYWYPN